MTHKKLILMALMGVMLSDADAGGKKVKQVHPKAHKIGSRGRAQSARGNVVTDADNTQGGKGPGLFDDDTGTEQDPKPDPDPAPKNNEQKNTPTRDKLTLDEDKLAAKFKVSPNVKAGLALEDETVDGYTFLSKVLGGDDLSTVSGQGKRMQLLAALGENDQRLGDILPGQVAYDIIKAAAEGSDLRPNMTENNVIKNVDNIQFSNVEEDKKIKFGTAEYQLVAGQHAAANGVITVPQDLQQQYDAFVRALDNVVLLNAKGEAKEFNVENKTDFASELVSGGSPKTTAAMQSVIRNAYKTAVDSFVDQLKSKAAKEKLFLPVVTAKNSKDVALAARPTADIKGFASGSNVKGIQATDGANNGFALRLIDLKKGAKKNILDTSSGMMAYNAGYKPAGVEGANPKLSAFITEPGMKAFKKGAELYYSQEVDKKSEFSLEKLLNDISAEARKEVNTTGLQKARAENKKDKIDAEKAKISSKMEAIVKRSMSKQGLSRFGNAVPKDTEELVG
jgi:hypothetical protein